MQPKRKHIASHRRARGPVMIIDNEDLSSDDPCSQYDTLPTPAVNKVQEALKSSSLELRAIVTDPLPDALLQAEAVVSDMARANQIPEPSVGMDTNVDKPALNPSVNASLDPLQHNQGNRKDESCSHRSNVPKSSLMERNSTAHTYQVLICCLFSLSSICAAKANILCLADDVCNFTLYFIVVAVVCFLLSILHDLNSSCLLEQVWCIYVCS